MADTVLTELKIHEFDTLEQMSQYESEIGDNDLVLTPDTTAKLFLFKHAWADYLVSDMSWLRADTFSWHSGETYETAYEHLVGDVSANYYAWVDRHGTYGFNAYTTSETPIAGDNIYNEQAVVIGTCSSYSSGALAWTGTDGTGYSSWLRETGSDLPSKRTDTIGNTTITYYLADDGHKICLPDQESNLRAVMQATGVAWYYILDTENKQFKLPRTKYGFTGLRDSVGGYVAPGLPNITGTLGEDQQARNPGNMVGDGVFQSLGQMNGKDSDGSSATRSWGVSFDASRSSSIYGNSDTVQPPATQMYLYFYVGNFGQTAVEQTAGVTTETLNGKADIDLGNLPTNIDYVVESQVPTADNGYTWFRKYKSGWVEQGGITTFAKHNANTSTENTVSLPVEMADAQYYVAAPTFITDAGNSQGLRNFRNTRGVTTLKIGMHTTATLSNSYNVQWRVSGYAAE